MDVFGNSDDHDVHGHEPHDVFGMPEGADVHGNGPMDVWGNQLSAWDDDHDSHLNDHDGDWGSLFDTHDE